MYKFSISFNFCILIILLSLLACQKKSKSKTSCSSDIIGTWTWVETKCCGRGAKITNPENTGENKSIVVTKETIQYINGKESLPPSPYQTGSNASGEKTIQINEGRIGKLRLYNDTLVIDYSYMDLQKEIYIRAKK